MLNGGAGASRPSANREHAAPRYALYYVPAADSALWHLGCTWLGRDPSSEALVSAPALEALGDARTAALVEVPRRYGFHATLKAPMRLIEGQSEANLLETAQRWAASQSRFEVQLRCASLGRFLALIPSTPGEATQLRQLAAACVQDFDHFRAPMSAAEVAERQSKGLSARQSELLERWGYPYVMEEFRFHMTLSRSIEDPSEKASLGAAAEYHFGPALIAAVPIDTLGVCVEPEAGTPFHTLARFRIGKS